MRHLEMRRQFAVAVAYPAATIFYFGSSGTRIRHRLPIQAEAGNKTTLTSHPIKFNFVF